MTTVWSPHRDLRSLVERGYTVVVGAQRNPLVPDGRAAIVWASDGVLCVCGPVTRSWRPDRSGVEVTGLQLVLGAWPALVDAPAQAFVNERIDLAELWDDTAELTDRLARADSAEVRLTLLQDELRCRRMAFDVDPVVGVLADHLTRPSARISTIADRIGLSPRQLHRRCQRALGYPPSVLARLVRFQQFLDRLNQRGPHPPRLVDLAIAAGYADQAHLTRDCRTLTGLRPSSLAPPLRR